METIVSLLTSVASAAEEEKTPLLVAVCTCAVMRVAFQKIHDEEAAKTEAAEGELPGAAAYFSKPLADPALDDAVPPPVLANPLGPPSEKMGGGKGAPDNPEDGDLRCMSLKSEPDLLPVTSVVPARPMARPDMLIPWEPAGGSNGPTEAWEGSASTAPMARPCL
eukprot:TRINITY_DN21379_c0_g1_i1.p3 TRINITY_DN21379_c0_g1~~TRINITY_DN21379_c0_g1_i1.p3  ORF type:complete len:174 (+),score=29.69 TRINITY_DN21379_c0_g1_i1:28-522(+)